MDLFKVGKFKKARKPNPQDDLESDKPVSQPGEPRDENAPNVGCDNVSNKCVSGDTGSETETEEDDDDDFITNEVKRKLKELRRNSFMVLIPEEEPCVEEEDEDDDKIEGETCSSEWRDVEAEGRKWWSGFDVFYDKYCERMLFFDRIMVQQFNENGCRTPLTPSPKTPSPRSASKKLASPFRCLSLKKIEELEDEMARLQQSQNDPYQDLEMAYVAQVCLSWEALHCQYTQLSRKIFCQPESKTCYNQSAQHFQQFQVLLQRFIENEPFQEGLRAEIYARAKNLLPRLLQVPNGKGLDQKETAESESDLVILAPDFIKIMESVILTFHMFLKMDKKKANGVLNLFGNQNQIATPLHLIQSSLDKKRMKLKELCKKSKGWKKKAWPKMYDDVELLFGLIDVKILSRVLRMGRITKDQLLWCEEKMKKLRLSNGKLERDPSPILFPC